LFADRPDRRQKQMSGRDSPSIAGLPRKKPPSSVKALGAREVGAAAEIGWRP